MAKKAKIAQNIFFLLGALALGFMIYKTGIDNICAISRQTGWWLSYHRAMGSGLPDQYLLLYLILRDGGETKRWFPAAVQVGDQWLCHQLYHSFGLMGGDPIRSSNCNPRWGFRKPPPLCSHHDALCLSFHLLDSIHSAAAIPCTSPLHTVGWV